MSHYNPFTLFNGSAFYATYVKWNGKSIDFSDELKSDVVYRVKSVDFGSSHTQLELQEIETGKTLKYTYNALLFKPLKGFVGISRNIPIPGEELYLFHVEIPEIVFRPVNTPKVLGVEKISENVFNAITFDAVYTVMVID